MPSRLLLGSFDEALSEVASEIGKLVLVTTVARPAVARGQAIQRVA